VAHRLEAVRHACKRGLSQRQACTLLQVSRSMLYYRHRMPERDAALRVRVEPVVRENPTWGYRLVAGQLCWEGEPVSDKRMLRWWQKEGYCAHWRKKRKKIHYGIQTKPEPVEANTVWAMDFAEDRLENGRAFLALLVKDEATAYGLLIRNAPSFKAKNVLEALEELLERHGRPQYIRCDNGGQFIAFVLRQWAKDKNIRIAYIQPGKPWQNGSAESFVGTYRREVLDAELFHSVIEAQVISERWLRKYNEKRPHSRLNRKPPISAYPAKVAMP
jgi:putative transposase